MRLPVALSLLVIACGSGTPTPAPSPAPGPTVEVPDTEESEPPAEEVSDSEPAPARSEALDDCAQSLRADPAPNAPAAEASAYKRAYAIEQRSDWSEARRAYFEIVQNMPTSPYVPAVYLAFAELFKRESESDPSKWELARQAYSEVLKYPPPNNTVYTYAALRLAQVEVAKQDFQQALAGFKRVLDATARQPDVACAKPIAETARAGMVAAYAEVGAPDKAWAFFNHLDREHGGEMVSELAAELSRRGKKAEACVAARSNPAFRGSCP
jgi:tetratricopeptide (TPR) repeat protein